MNTRTESPSTESPEQLIRSIQKLMDEVEAIVSKSAEPTNGEFGHQLGELQDRLTRVSDRARGFYTSARRKVTEGAHRADETIRNHPYETLAVALGVGVLLGAVLRRGGD